MKPCTPPEMIEGPEAYTRFTNAMRKLVSVPREELARREAEYKRQSEAKPKRGPKRKA